MFLSRNKRFDPHPNPGVPQDFADSFDTSIYRKELSDESIKNQLSRDLAPIPPTAYREHYHGDRHYDYWLSGLRDYERILGFWEAHGGGRPIESYLDFGGSSGRVARHVASAHPSAQVYCADLGITAVEWALTHLPGNVQAFQTTVLPGLPIRDASVDLITAFSVFTHIDTHEYGWLAELARILAPGGVCYLTLMTEETWDACMRIDWRYEALLRSVVGFDRYERGTPMPEDQDRIPFYDQAGAYGTTFHRRRHVENVWSRFFDIKEIWVPPRVQTIGEQTAVILGPKT